MIYASISYAPTLVGLTEMELEDLLSCNDKVMREILAKESSLILSNMNELLQHTKEPLIRLPPLYMARVLYDLRRMIIEVLLERRFVIRWTFSAIGAHVLERYLNRADPELIAELHEHFVEYYSAESPIAKPFSYAADKSVLFRRATLYYPLRAKNNARKLRALAHHLLETHDVARFCSRVCFSLEFIRLYLSGMGFECWVQLLRGALERIKHWIRVSARADDSGAPATSVGENAPLTNRASWLRLRERLYNAQADIAALYMLHSTFKSIQEYYLVRNEKEVHDNLETYLLSALSGLKLPGFELRHELLACGYLVTFQVSALTISTVVQ